MNLLTDREIREHLEKGELVENGVPDDAVGCSYKFKSGKIFPAGSHAPPLDWDLESVGSTEFIAEPGKVFWIRTNHKVCLPDDICAFWWQTNELSKKGIMLVNMSMVDPGYHGFLACLFVNFGNQVVPINRSTTVARLVFVRLGSSVDRPYRSSIELAKYDGQLREIALNAASSFLQVNEQAARVAEELEAFERDAAENRKKLKDETDRLKASLDASLKDFVAREGNEIRSNLVGAIKKAFWPYGVILVVVTVVATITWKGLNEYIDSIRPRREEVLRKQVEEQINKAIAPAIQQIIDETLRRRLPSSTPTAVSPTNAQPLQPKSP